MRQSRTRVLTALAVMTAAALLIPAAGSTAAKSRNVAIKMNTPPKGTTLKGTWSEKTLGRGTARGTLRVPLTKLTFKTRGGTFSTTTYDCPEQKVSPPTFRGCWRVTKGTGKFKGMKGGGKLSGNFNGRATYRGKVTY